MVFNWKRTISYTLAAAAVVSSISAGAEAASGISALSSKGTLDSSAYSSFAGVSLTVNDILANATTLAQESQLADNEATEVAESEYANIAIAQVDNYVYIRSEASAESEYVGKLYDNSAATVSDSVEAEDGTWLLITSGDCTGYVKSDYVVQNDEKLAKSVSTRLAKVNTETLYVRQEPSTESSVIDMVPLDDDVVVIDESTVDSGWVKVTCDAGEGYVSMDYVTLSTQYTTAESKEHEEARLAREEAEREAAAAAAKKATSSKKSSSSSSSSSSGKSYSSASGSGGGAVVSYGSQFVGNPYVYGGSSLTSGTDCSGFVMSVYAAYGISLPHSSSAMRSVGYGVSTSEMQPGDIVCYSGHVGIYAGNGTLLHASNKRTGITYSNVDYKPILAVRRIF